MSTRKKLKQTMDRVDKIAKVLNSSQANVLYTNGFILGATSGGGGGTTYTAGNGIDITNNVISVSTTTGIEDPVLTGTTNAENITVQGDLTLEKGAHFTASTSAEVTVDCVASFNGDTTFTKNAIFTDASSIIVDEDTTVTGLVKELGNEAVSGEPYHFPYHMVLTPTTDSITATAYTVTLDNSKTLNNYTFSLPAATTSTAGLMTSEDKTKLNNTNCSYQTTAPTSAITDNGVHIVYLGAEPVNKYAGYIYIIQ